MSEGSAATGKPTVEEVEFCGCTNEDLEAGRTCGLPPCPNLYANEPRDPIEVYGTPEHEAWLIEMERQEG